MGNAVRRDEEFYYELPTSIFLVEDVLFKVPTLNFVQESDVFKTMFSLPQPTSMTVEGRTDDQPIRLEGVKRDDFRNLLKVLYPPGFGQRRELTVAEWEAVLTLSTTWDMDRVRNTAIVELGPTYSKDPFGLFHLGQKHSVHFWIFSAVESLILREKPVDEELVNGLGLAEALKIASIREACTHAVYNSGISPKRGRLSSRRDIDERIKSEYSLDSIPASKDRIIKNW